MIVLLTAGTLASFAQSPNTGFYLRVLCAAQLSSMGHRRWKSEAAWPPALECVLIEGEACICSIDIVHQPIVVIALEEYRKSSCISHGRPPSIQSAVPHAQSLHF
jgi:hypothetical protein